MSTAAPIHDTYIATGGWQEDTWNWLMGYIGQSGWTLVNVVASGLEAVGDFVEDVKDAAETVENAVKAGMEWISNNVFGPIVDEFVALFQLLLKSMGYILQMIPTLDVSILTDGISVDTIDFRVYRSDLDIVIQLNNQKMILSSIYFLPIAKIEAQETLGGIHVAFANQVVSLMYEIFMISTILGVKDFAVQAEKKTEKREGLENRNDPNHADYRPSAKDYAPFDIQRLTREIDGLDAQIMGGLSGMNKLLIGFATMNILSTVLYTISGASPTDKKLYHESMVTFWALSTAGYSIPYLAELFGAGGVLLNGIQTTSMAGVLIGNAWAASDTIKEAYDNEGTVFRTATIGFQILALSIGAITLLSGYGLASQTGYAKYIDEVHKFTGIMAFISFFLLVINQILADKY